MRAVSNVSSRVCGTCRESTSSDQIPAATSANASSSLTALSTHLLHDLDQPQRDLVDTPSFPPPGHDVLYQRVDGRFLRGRWVLEVGYQKGGLLGRRGWRFHGCRCIRSMTMVWILISADPEQGGSDWVDYRKDVALVLFRLPYVYGRQAEEPSREVVNR